MWPTLCLLCVSVCLDSYYESRDSGVTETALSSHTSIHIPTNLHLLPLPRSSPVPSVSIATGQNKLLIIGRGLSWQVVYTELCHILFQIGQRHMRYRKSQVQAVGFRLKQTCSIYTLYCYHPQNAQFPRTCLNVSSSAIWLWLFECCERSRQHDSWRSVTIDFHKPVSENQTGGDRKISKRGRCWNDLSWGVAARPCPFFPWNRVQMFRLSRITASTKTHRNGRLEKIKGAVSLQLKFSIIIYVFRKMWHFSYLATMIKWRDAVSQHPRGYDVQLWLLVDLSAALAEDWVDQKTLYNLQNLKIHLFILTIM